MFASIGGYQEVVRALLLTNAEVNAKGEAGNTALMFA
ncbi:MAG: ankyrin repeat domain-containing protein [Bryobacteraceae bacterium]|jgi:ankyrin repeat protein